MTPVPCASCVKDADSATTYDASKTCSLCNKPVCLKHYIGSHKSCEENFCVNFLDARKKKHDSRPPFPGKNKNTSDDDIAFLIGIVAGALMTICFVGMLVANHPRALCPLV